MSDNEKASLRSQGGAGAGATFSTSPTCFLTRIEPPFFRTLLLRRLRLPLPLTQRSCRCGRPLQLARGRGCWDGGGSLLKARQPAFAVREVRVS